MSFDHSMLLDRFVLKTKKGVNGCILWTAHCDHTGYGRIGKGRKVYPANRVSFELFVGPIPDGLFVLHKCDNRPCVNPMHLFLGTAKDNTEDMIQKGRMIVGDHRGIRHGSAKLNDAAIVEIRRRRDGGEKLKPIADDFGVDVSLISLIGLRKIWKHVP
jgi:hypothetical protein